MKKYDLHMHTTYSDGTLSVPEILNLSTQKKLDVISITDHNNVDAYFELQQKNYSHIYNGKIIKGVEIYSYYQGKVIEFLVYDYNLTKMQQFLLKHYSKEWSNNRINYVLDKLKQVATKKGLVFDKDFTIKTDVGECVSFFRHLISFKENKSAFSDDIVSGKKSFFRNEVCNPKSDFYVDYGSFYLSPKQIIDFVKETGGVIFLAHLHEYNLKEPTKLLDYVRDLGIDGIECFYPTFTKEQIEFLLDYTKKYNLFCSGGSDFHGEKRINQLSVLNDKIKINNKHFIWTKNLLNVNHKQNFDVKCLTLTKKTPITNLKVNTIVATDKKSAIIFDPSNSLNNIKKHIKNLTVKAIFLTHSHWDHILSLIDCLNEFKCPLYIHPNAKQKFKDSYLNCSKMHNLNLTFNLSKNTKIIELKNKSNLITIDNWQIKYYHTPGHSDDSISYMLKQNLVCGDSLRLNKQARTDLPTSDDFQLKNSIDFYKSLDKNIMVYNGHEQPDLLKKFYI